MVGYLLSVKNVPRSLTNEGHEIVEVAHVNDTDWPITNGKLAFGRRRSSLPSLGARLSFVDGMEKFCMTYVED